MDFNEFLSNKKKPTKRKKNPADKINLANFLLESETVETSDIPTITPNSKASDMNFIGRFNYVPNPNDYSDGAQYRNINEGVVYIKRHNLWEEYVRDGKQGAPARWSPSGGGLGERDVRKIVNESLTSGSATNITVSSAAPSGIPSDGAIWIVTA